MPTTLDDCPACGYLAARAADGRIDCPRCGVTDAPPAAPPSSPRPPRKPARKANMT